MSKDRKHKNSNKKFIYEDGAKNKKIDAYDRNRNRKKAKAILDKVSREIDSEFNLLLHGANDFMLVRTDDDQYEFQPEDDTDETDNLH